MFHEETLTGMRYRDEIFDLYAHSFSFDNAIGNDFILMADNPRSHRTVVGLS